MRCSFVALALAVAFLAVGPVRAAAGIASAEASAPQAPYALAGARLTAALRAGGYVVYFRHTATDFSRDDRQMKGYEDCANQRLLNESGRRAARLGGERIRELHLAEGEVLASPMCRTMEHARLVFGRSTPTPAMRELDGGDYPGLKQLLASPVPAGRNRWLFGHGTPFRTVAGPPHLAEGEAVVLAPTGSGWHVVARIGAQDWAALTMPR
jgi:hypothetical protein